MKRDDEIFDGRIREIVDSFDEVPGQDVWERIEKDLDRIRFRTVLRRTVYYSAAAVLVAGLFLGVLFYNPYEGSNAPETITAQVTEEKDTVAAAEGSCSILAEAILTENAETVAQAGTVAVVPDEQSVVEADAKNDIQDDVLAVPQTGTVDNASESLDATEETQVAQEEEREKGAAGYDYIAMSDVYGDGMTYTAKKKKPSFSISASGLLSPTNASGNVDFGQPNYSVGGTGTTGMQGITPVYGIRHYFPVSAGLELKYSFLNDRLGVGLGVNYTFLISSYEALVNFGKPFQGTVEQSIHYIGVPLNFYVNILSGNRISFYANAGCMVERAIRISYDITDLYSAKYRKSIDPSGVQWSANVGIGLEYRFFDFMGLYVDPRLTYFFDCGQPYSVRAEQPLQFNLELGFRFHI